MERVVDLSMLSPYQRLAKLLLLLHTGTEGVRNEENPEIDLSQLDMCALINASRSTVNKLVQD